MRMQGGIFPEAKRGCRESVLPQGVRGCCSRPGTGVDPPVTAPLCRIGLQGHWHNHTDVLRSSTLKQTKMPLPACGRATSPSSVHSTAERAARAASTTRPLQSTWHPSLPRCRSKAVPQRPGPWPRRKRWPLHYCPPPAPQTSFQGLQEPAQHALALLLVCVAFPPPQPGPEVLACPPPEALSLWVHSLWKGLSQCCVFQRQQLPKSPPALASQLPQLQGGLGVSTWMSHRPPRCLPASLSSSIGSPCLPLVESAISHSARVAIGSGHLEVICEGSESAPALSSSPEPSPGAAARMPGKEPPCTCSFLAPSMRGGEAAGGRRREGAKPLPAADLWEESERPIAL